MNAPPDPQQAGADPPSRRRVFVAGGTGVVGSRAVQGLVAAGHRVTVVARTPEKAATVRSWGAEPVQVGLFDPPALTAAVAGHDVVCNLATHIPRSSRAARARSWAANERIRREGAANLADAALAAGARTFVQESLAFVYRDGGTGWLDEDSPLELVPPVEAVAAAEASAARFTAAGGTGVVLRFGAFVAAEGHLTQDLVGLARRGMSTVMGAPGAYKASIHADDAARAVLAALGADAGVYNVVDDEPFTRAQQEAALAELVGRARLRGLAERLRPLGGPGADLLARSQRVSNRRFGEVTGWRPRYPDVGAALRAVVAELDAPTAA